MDRREVRDTSPMDTDDRLDCSVIRHDDRSRYELEVGGDVVAFVDFSQGDEVMTIPYIETDVRHRGNGYSSALMDGVIEDLRDRGVQVRATCSFAWAHLAEHAAELLVQ